MPTSLVAANHVSWFSKKRPLSTSESVPIEIWRFSPDRASPICSAWAKHFRNHYCADDEIDDLRRGTGLSRRDYLSSLIFPDATAAPGPSIRSGDFAEILFADLLEHRLKFWVPRFRYEAKAVRNVSTPGTDILAFKRSANNRPEEDVLVTYEVKANLTGGVNGNVLQKAVDHSSKDFIVRKAESLNALKRRLRRAGKLGDASIVERFQNKADQPYQEVTGAGALVSDAFFDSTQLVGTDISGHPNKSAIALVVIKGPDLMPIANMLYEKAADEA